MKSTIISILVAAAIIGGALYFAKGSDVASTANVFMENGKQIVEITAGKDYSPHLTAAKAGIPTVIRMKTTGTFNCTSSLKVPSAGFQGMLPLSGTTDIAVPEQSAGTSVTGVCAMGMYNFAVNFN